MINPVEVLTSQNGSLGMKVNFCIFLEQRKRKNVANKYQKLRVNKYQNFFLIPPTFLSEKNWELRFIFLALHSILSTTEKYWKFFVIPPQTHFYLSRFSSNWDSPGTYSLQRAPLGNFSSLLTFRKKIYKNSSNSQNFSKHQRIAKSILSVTGGVELPVLGMFCFLTKQFLLNDIKSLLTEPRES